MRIGTHLRAGFALLLLAVGASVSAARPTAAASFQLGSLQFATCDLKDRSDGDLLGARCAYLQVPENPAEPAGRQIQLRIALAAANNVKPTEDPVFFLAGGPGQSAVEAYPQIAAGLARVREKRHLLMVDQRGTGASNPLKCEGKDGKSAYAADDDSAAAQVAFVRGCLQSLAGRADPRFYTTTVAVTDLDRVRQAIGAEKINLFGVSYGTRVAQVYLRHYPSHVRSIVLDGVVPPDLVLGNDFASNLESALQGIFERCKKAADCHAAFADPAADLARLLAALRGQSQRVDYRDPKTGELLSEDLTAADVGGVVRLFAYTPETAALLPLALHEAVNGQPQALLAQSRLITGDLSEQIMHAMQMAVICSEDGPYLMARPEDAATVMGNDFVNALQTQCAVWPTGERPTDFYAAPLSAVPTLLLSGEFDPVTPPRYGEATLKHFSHGRHLLVAGRGHNVMTAGCVPRLLAQFVEQADAGALDVACLKDFAAIPAFLNRNGWAP